MDTPYADNAYADVPILLSEATFSVTYLGSGTATFELGVTKSLQQTYNASATKSVDLGRIAGFKFNSLGTGSFTLSLTRLNILSVTLNGSSSKELQLGAIRSYIWAATGVAYSTFDVFRLLSFNVSYTSSASVSQLLDKLKLFNTSFSANSIITKYEMLRKAGLNLYVPGQAFLKKDLNRIKKRSFSEVIHRPRGLRS